MRKCDDTSTCSAAFAAVRLPHQYGRADVETVEEFVESDFLKANPFGGCSVTIPHKQTIMPYVDVLSDAAKTIGSVNALIVEDKIGKMIRSKQQPLLLSTIRLLAIALLSWWVVANICTALTVTASWTKASLSAPSAVRGSWNPFSSNALHQRQVFWTTYSYARLLLDPFYLVVQGAATLFLFGHYQRFVSNIEQKWITQAQRDKYPLLYRVAALFLAFVSNLAVAGIVTLCGVGFGTIVGQWKLQVFG